MEFVKILQFFIILCLPLGALCSSSNVTTNVILDVYADLPKLEGRIVNGTKASMGQFPHQVSLRRSYSNSHFCGGSVIASGWVLTAAHCMFKNNGVQIMPWSITVTAGHVRLNQTDSYVQSRAVEAIIVHKEFQKETLTNDIALLKVKTPFNLNTTYVKAATMETKMPNPGTKCKVSGWGYLAENKQIVSNDLMYVVLPLINPIRCKQLLVNVTKLPLGMFCAGYEEGLRDACQGDSGGGMICGKTLAGIVSGGEGCARPALPGLYADVPYYHNWVTYQIRNYNGSVDDYNPTTKIIESNNNSCCSVYSSFSLSALLGAYFLLSLAISGHDRV